MGWKYLKTTLLTFMLLLSVGLLFSMHRLGKSVDTAHDELREAVDGVAREARHLELRVVLDRCGWEPDGVSSVERDPCRLICWSMTTDETFWTEALAEDICQELP